METTNSTTATLNTIRFDTTFSAVLSHYDAVSADFEKPDPTLPDPADDTAEMQPGDSLQEQANAAAYNAATSLLIAAIDAHTASEVANALRHYRQTQENRRAV